MPKGYNTEGEGPNPGGLCRCGCGQPAPIAKGSDARVGAVAGKPLQYIRHHQSRTETYCDPNPSGRCWCGCGETTTLRGTRHGRYVTGHNGRMSPVEYLIEDRGYETPCWIWQRAKNQLGYGIGPMVSGVRQPAHRDYYQRFIGPIPDGLELDHRCSVRDCVNPAHLEAVTHTENVRRGSNTKLTVEDVTEIRRAKREGTTRTSELAETYGVTPKYINMLARGIGWVGVA